MKHTSKMKQFWTRTFNNPLISSGGARTAGTRNFSVLSDVCDKALDDMKAAGAFKEERVITSKQNPSLKVEGYMRLYLLMFLIIVSLILIIHCDYIQFKYASSILKSLNALLN